MSRYTEQDVADYQSRRGIRIDIKEPPKKNKYSAIKTEVDGIIFDSRREATRYTELRIMQRQGLISGLKLQVTYPLAVNNIHICSFRADFEYMEDGQKIVEDAKGVRTREYKIKRNLMRAIYGIEIRET